MKFEFNFGTLDPSKLSGTPRNEACFRMAVLGDFSARSHGGPAVTGQELARRKPRAVDVDCLDEVLQRFGIRLQLPLGAGGETLPVPIGKLEDLHPDALCKQLKVFAELEDLRRRLQEPGTFAEAARAVQALLGELPGEAAPPAPPAPVVADNAAVPDASRDDFSRLLGRPATAQTAAELQVEQWIRQVVSPHIVPVRDPGRQQWVAAVDAAMSEAMRRVLHHPDFQAFEALWRSVDMLTRRLETGADLQIVLYDVSAVEFAADLTAVDALEQSGLYSLLVEQPASDVRQGPLSVILADYTFPETVPGAALLGRAAHIAAAAGAPLIANVHGARLQDPTIQIDAEARQAWAALRRLPQAAFLGLTLPRYLVRLPYGRHSDPIESFAFEEFVADRGERGLLWGHSAFLVGLLMGQAFCDEGVADLSFDTALTVDDLPVSWYRDADGEQVAIACTEFVVSEPMAGRAVEESWMPLLAMRGRSDVRLAGFRSLSGGALRTRM